MKLMIIINILLIIFKLILKLYKKFKENILNNLILYTNNNILVNLCERNR